MGIDPGSILFVRGLALLALSATALLRQRNESLPPRMQERVNLPWAWLALFGAIHGLNEWLSLLPAGQALGRAFGAIQFALRSASLLALFEFGRRGLLAVGQKATGQKAAGRKSLPAWLHGLLAAVAVLGMLGGEASWLPVFCQVAIGLPAGLLAAFVVWQASRELQGSVAQQDSPVRQDSPVQRESSAKSRGERAGLVLAAVTLGVYAPASPLAFSGFAAFQGLLALGSLAILAGFWFAYHQARRDSLATGLRQAWRWCGPAAFAIVAFAGGMALQGRNGLSEGMADGNLVVAAGEGDAADSAAIGFDDGPQDWENMASERWRRGLPVLAVFFLVVVGCVAAHQLRFA